MAELLEAYQALLNTARCQATALAAEDLDAFEQASQAREAAFEAVRRHEPESASLTDEAREAVLGTIRELLALDDALEARITQLASSASAELSTLQNGLSALQSYLPAGGGRAFFIDQSS